MAISTKGNALAVGMRMHMTMQQVIYDEISHVKYESQGPRWLKRREGNYSFYVGMDGAKGWSIYPRQFGYYLHRSKPWPATNFGPFDSFEAAKAAFTIMKDIK